MTAPGGLQQSVGPATPSPALHDQCVASQANGKTHTVHVAGKYGVLCDRPRLGGRLGRNFANARLVERARQDLAARLGVDPEAVQTGWVRPTVWPDASLGCPKPDMVYAQVETPGYEIELEANGKTYRYHAEGHARVKLSGNPYLAIRIKRVEGDQVEYKEAVRVYGEG